MQRLPVLMIAGTQLGTAAVTATSYVTPGAAGATLTAPQSYTTINQATINNTSAVAATVTVNLIPPAGSAAAANEIVSALSIPAAGSVPTVLSALIGMPIPAGYTLAFKSGTATVLTPVIGGYLTTP